MPDLGPLAEALAPVVKEIVGPVLRALLRSVVGTVFLALVVAGGCFAIAADGNWLHGVAGMVLGLITCAVCGGILVAKRAVLTAVRSVVAKAQLGRRTLGVVFERMLNVDAQDAFMDRGGAVARTLERLPLAQAEERLKRAVDSLVRAPEAGGGFGGWLRRGVQVALLRRVEAVTLAEFRENWAAEGGVDMVVAQRKLGDSVDAKIIAGIDGAMMKVTAMFVGIACVLSVTGAVLIRSVR